MRQEEERALNCNFKTAAIREAWATRLFSTVLRDWKKENAKLSHQPPDTRDIKMRNLFPRVALSLIGLMILSPTGHCQSICPDEQRQAAIGAIRSQLHLEFPLQAIALPSLTDDVISIETNGLPRPVGTQVEIMNFYKIIPSSYQLDGNKIVSKTVELDNYKEWLVAVNRRNNTTYLLEGSADTITEFNKLEGDLHLQVSDANAALDIFDFFLKVARGQEFRSHVVPDEMKLESLALEDFRLRFPTGQRRAAFSSWWAGVSENTKKALLTPKAIPVKNGYDIQYFFYSQGNISKQNLTINADGTVTEGKSTIIVTGNPGSAT
jgi:hypothetical protein